MGSECVLSFEPTVCANTAVEVAKDRRAHEERGDENDYYHTCVMVTIVNALS